MIGGLTLLLPSLGDLEPDPSLLGCFLYAGGATALLAAHAWDDIDTMPADPVGMLRWWFGGRDG